MRHSRGTHEGLTLSTQRGTHARSRRTRAVLTPGTLRYTVPLKDGPRPAAGANSNGDRRRKPMYCARARHSAQAVPHGGMVPHSTPRRHGTPQCPTAFALRLAALLRFCLHVSAAAADSGGADRICAPHRRDREKAALRGSPPSRGTLGGYSGGYYRSTLGGYSGASACEEMYS